jgi:hypothetical protein
MATASASGAPGSSIPPARIPDFFIVGHAKSGTTALYEMLREHPQIFLPASKEPWYFAQELHERTPPRPEGTPRTLDEYRAWFAGAEPGQQVGEASVLYLWSRTAAPAIAAVQPEAKIIAILREPASFLRSLHLQLIESYVETEHDFERALALETERRAGRSIPRHTYWPKTLLYSEHVRYAEQLRRYHEAFGRERVLVLVYEDFLADNDATVRRVQRFLGVDDTVPIVPSRANPTVQMRSPRLHSLMHAVSVGRGRGSLAVKSALKAVMPAEARRTLVRTANERLLHRAPEEVDDAFMERLRSRYKPEVVALSEYLGEDFVARWGYEHLQ